MSLWHIPQLHDRVLPVLREVDKACCRCYCLSTFMYDDVTVLLYSSRVFLNTKKEIHIKTIVSNIKQKISTVNVDLLVIHKRPLQQ